MALSNNICGEIFYCFKLFIYLRLSPTPQGKQESGETEPRSYTEFNIKSSVTT